MTQERQDGWYWVKWPWWKGLDETVPGKWAVAVYDAANDEWIDQGLHRRHPPMEIGPRIPSPDEPKAPDLLAVVAAAQEWRDAVDVHDGSGMAGGSHSAWQRVQATEHALRSALANLKLEERVS